MPTTIWEVDYNSQKHTIRLEHNPMVSTISIWLDDRMYFNKFFWYLPKDIHQFNESGHFFAVHKSGLTVFDMKFSLMMDGRVIPPASVSSFAIPAGIIPGVQAQAVAPPQQPAVPPPASTPVQIVGQGPLAETTEIVGRDEYPLDNRYGDQVLSIEQEISRTATNEISLDREFQINAGGNFDILSYVKADLSAHFTQTTGVKIGDTVTRRQMIKLSTGAHQFVIYTVVWKRRVTQGTCYINIQNAVQPVPYQVAFDLSFEIASRPGQNDDSPKADS